MAIATSKYHHNEKQITDEEVLIKAAMKEARDFKPLYDKYFLMIFKYVIKRVCDESDAGEITAIVFSKALANLGKYEFRGVPFGAWLFRIAHNEVIKLLKENSSKRVVRMTTEQLGIMVEEADESNNEEKVKLMIEALKQLPQPEIDLIELRFFEQRSFKEMGNILDLTENNARVKTHRVIKKLQNIITK